MSFAAADRFVGYGFVTWAPAFFIRSFGMTTGEIGTVRPHSGHSGGIGIVMGGWLADKFGAKDPKWYLWTTAIALILVTRSILSSILRPTAPWRFWDDYSGLVGQFLSGHHIQPNRVFPELRMRAVAAGILLFIINIIGLGFGPKWSGSFSIYYLTAMAESLRYALLICSLVNIWAGIHYFLGGRHLKDDLVAEG